MILNTDKLIPLLPFDPAFKKDLQARYQALKPDERYELATLIHEAYYAYYRIKLEENMQLEYQKMEDSKVTPGPDFYNRVKEQTEKQLEQEQASESTNQELVAVRNKLQSILSNQSV